MRTCDPKKVLIILFISSMGSGIVSHEISTILVQIFKEENLQDFKERNAGKIFLQENGKLEQIPINSSCPLIELFYISTFVYKVNHKTKFKKLC